MESPFHKILNDMKSVLIRRHDYFLLKQTQESPRPLPPQQMTTRTANRSGGLTRRRRHLPGSAVPPHSTRQSTSQHPIPRASLHLTKPHELGVNHK